MAEIVEVVGTILAGVVIVFAAWWSLRGTEK
jgi:hypothetical protein